jgi:two-component system, chemotaxis family, protein-glutamate methylesterase/glutaminase
LKNWTVSKKSSLKTVNVVTPIKEYSAIIIGASAGGFYALSVLLEDLMINFPIPIIIVQHRSRDYKDLLEEVLQKRCRIRIKQADEKEIIKESIVYVAPPDYHLLIEDDHSISLSDDPPVNYSRPSIDVSFESAARVYRERLVGIILSGANSDGAIGIREIKKSGGLTVAQDPAEAQFKTMPLAAVNTGKVDKIMTLEKIRDFLNSYNNKDEK